MLDHLPYRQIRVIDFEFRPKSVARSGFEFVENSGERPAPVCFVSKELRTGEITRLNYDQLKPGEPPFPMDDDVLVVGYFICADLGCFRALNWSMPRRVLDLYAEFRMSQNFLDPKGSKPRKSGLINALTAHGLDAMGAGEKTDMRNLVLRGGPWTGEETTAYLDYCQIDVEKTAQLVTTMAPTIDLPRALIRGRYMGAVSAMEWAGPPIDVTTLNRFREGWFDIQDQLIAEIDRYYDVYEGRTFKTDKFAAALTRLGITSWPLTETGQLSTEDDTFADMAKSYPALGPLRDLKYALGQMRLNDLAVGHDARNRTLLSPFWTRTSRNMPSNKHFIFGPAVWLRGLIQPPPGYAIDYIDWSAQEFGIAAVLSKDPNMLKAYLSGDPYFYFAQLAGAIPADTPCTKESRRHYAAVREQYKGVCLGVQYGQTEYGIALKLGITVVAARALLAAHRAIFPVFWRWIDDTVGRAMLTNQIQSTFGWTAHLTAGSNPRALMNWPMQTNGAEMMRLAACMATEAGIEVVAPVHDAFLIMAPVDRIEHGVARMRGFMSEASAIVLDGFRLRAGNKTIRYPDQYTDDRGTQMWNTVMRCLDADRKGAANG
jgi:hypothetical protein